MPESRPDELRALTRLAFRELADAAGGIGGIHLGVAERVFRHVGPTSAPARLAHDAISAGVYRAVSRGAWLAGLGADLGLRRRSVRDGRAISSDPRGAAAIAALNGLIGDRLEREGSDLAEPMAVRIDGAIAGPSDFRSPRPRLVVFLHGLMETEGSWRWAGRETYGARLERELGCTPVYVRYNTGRHISENGRSLSELLESLVAGWPIEIEAIALVGHSMGGLVARSACHYGGDFAGAVRHVFCLGTPHLGADLEKGANALAWALGRLPETRPFGAVLNARSAGIKDLRYGSCVEEDWCDCDPDEFLRDRCREVPFLPGAHYYFVGATLNPAAVGGLLGDLFVRLPSASGRGRGRRIPFAVDHGHELAGLNHFDLLNHPAVYAQLRAWLDQPAAGATTPATPASPRAFG